jgi:hypothetical protein
MAYKTATKILRKTETTSGLADGDFNVGASSYYGRRKLWVTEKENQACFDLFRIRMEVHRPEMSFGGQRKRKLLTPFKVIVWKRVQREHVRYCKM